jgi:hypothetical protein
MMVTMYILDIYINDGYIYFHECDGLGGWMGCTYNTQFIDIILFMHQWGTKIHDIPR